MRVGAVGVNDESVSDATTTSSATSEDDDGEDDVSGCDGLENEGVEDKGKRSSGGSPNNWQRRLMWNKSGPPDNRYHVCRGRNKTGC